MEVLVVLAAMLVALARLLAPALTTLRHSTC